MTLEPDAIVAQLAACFRASNDLWSEVHAALCEIPAPAYAEAARAAALVEQFRAVGLEHIRITEVGNVIGRYRRSARGRRLAVSAHLDTVFGPEVAIKVVHDGEVLRAPGIGDDVSGLVMLPALAAALDACQVELPGELWFAATVGEESAGNLRGARDLAAHGVDGRALDGFITLDSSVPGQVIRHGTHSRNHDLVLTGPGGHAWGEFGVVQPNFVLARILARVADYPAPRVPRTTFNCGLLQGGFAPNAIPERARAHLNLRSETGEELAKLDAWARRAIDEAIADANSQRQHGPELGVDHTINNREGGETPADSPLVRAAVGAARRLGWPLSHPYSSTDANAFMAAGIDAVCVYRGDGGGEHTADEWYDAGTRPKALEGLAELVLRYFEQVD